MQKLLAASIIAVIATMLIVSVSTHYVDAQKVKKPKQCNNIKVQIRVNGVEENQTYVGSATIGTSAKTKVGTVEENETSITLPINFKKISPCPDLGSPIFGNVNGTGFESELKSYNKPNKVTVGLP